MLTVRPARLEDAAAMARVHVAAWQETYRGVVRDEVLDAPDAVERRTRMWIRILGDPGGRRASVAEEGGAIVGLALSVPMSVPMPVPMFVPTDDPPGRRLNRLYLLAAHHGSGAGRDLLDAVVGRDERVELMVADPNPRAQAFYRREGFVVEGEPVIEDGVRELRMVRAARA